MKALQGYGEVLWAPAATKCQQSLLTQFTKALAPDVQSRVRTWSELHQWSVNEKEFFWQSVADFFQLPVNGPALKGGEWFPKSQLNYAEYLLNGPQRFGFDPQSVAVVSIAEAGQRRSVSWAVLKQQVQHIAGFLQAQGVKPGDVVAGVVPNQLESLLCALATSYIGAVWSSCSLDFGLPALQDRLGQIHPKVLFASVAYAYKGKQLSTFEKLHGLTTALSSLEHVIAIPYLCTENTQCQWEDIAIERLWPKVENTTHSLHSFSQALASKPCTEPTARSFNDPLYILFSSGTTGKPKCIVHGCGGTLIQHIKELGLHTDIRPQEKLFYFSTCGWMMWNWLVSGLAVGATVVLFDGNPLYPNADRLLQLASDESVHHFGASAKYYAALSSSGVSGDGLDLASLRNILSTGSVLLPETFDYIYKALKQDVRVSSISGGTDIISCFALGNPWLPVRRGELQGPGLGMAVAVYDEQGNSVIDQQGELVCTELFPSRPLYFLNDPDGALYHDAYFSRFNGIWAQGDFAIHTKYDGFIILGRSDAVLNPGGVRIGTAEIYRQVEGFAGVTDALAVGKQLSDDEEIWLFVQMAPGLTMTADIAQELRVRIRTHASPRHVPAKIIQAPDLPRTRSGKIAELVVKKRINGQSVNNAEALANAQCLAFFSSAVENAKDVVF